MSMFIHRGHQTQCHQRCQAMVGARARSAIALSRLCDQHNDCRLIPREFGEDATGHAMVEPAEPASSISRVDAASAGSILHRRDRQLVVE